MSFSTNWDVNRYRADYESEEHWELRKAFIEAHKETFPEPELVCLAQVFTNIEFLGCKYPNKTMERVALLSRDVAAKFRDARSGRLKRTFVGASDAASAKAKGRGSQSEATQSINQKSGNKQSFPSLKSSFRKPESTTTTSTTQDESTNNDNSLIKRLPAIESDADDSDDNEIQARPNFSFGPSTKNQEEEQKNQFIIDSKITVKPKQLKYIQKNGFIIYETLAQVGQNSSNILQVSAAKQGATVKCDEEVCSGEPSRLQCVVRINNTVYGSAPIEQTKKEAKVQAFDNALKYARKIHYTIKQKSLHTVSVDVDPNDNGTGETAANAQTGQLNEDNKGFKMMKMLGWSGGALGVSGNGIEQPISIEMKVDRRGLGLSSESTTLDYTFFLDYLTKYKNDQTATYDLAFAKEFSKEERKTLHEIASRLALKSRSHNTDDGSRYIVIFKKLELIDLANEILNGGLRSKYYELIHPTEPVVEELKPVQKSLPPHLQQRKSNKIGFQHAQQYRKQQIQRKRKKFF